MDMDNDLGRLDRMNQEPDQSDLLDLIKSMFQPKPKPWGWQSPEMQEQRAGERGPMPSLADVEGARAANHEREAQSLLAANDDEPYAGRPTDFDAEAQMTAPSPGTEPSLADEMEDKGPLALGRSAAPFQRPIPRQIAPVLARNQIGAPSTGPSGPGGSGLAEKIAKLASLLDLSKSATPTQPTSAFPKSFTLSDITSGLASLRGTPEARANVLGQLYPNIPAGHPTNAPNAPVPDPKFDILAWLDYIKRLGMSPEAMADAKSGMRRRLEIQ